MFDVAAAAVEGALAAGARYADARVMVMRTEGMSVRNAVVEGLSQSETAGVGVRAELAVVQPGRVPARGGADLRAQRRTEREMPARAVPGRSEQPVRLLGEPSERRIDVEWDGLSKAQHEVAIQVLCADKPGLLAHISQSFTDQGVNISQAHCRATEDGRAVNTFRASVKDLDQLKSVIRQLSRIKGVYSVDRVAAEIGTGDRVDEGGLGEGSDPVATIAAGDGHLVTDADGASPDGEGDLVEVTGPNGAQPVHVARHWLTTSIGDGAAVQVAPCHSATGALLDDSEGAG